MIDTVINSTGVNPLTIYTYQNIILYTLSILQFYVDCCSIKLKFKKHHGLENWYSDRLANGRLLKMKEWTRLSRTNKDWEEKLWSPSPPQPNNLRHRQRKHYLEKSSRIYGPKIVRSKRIEIGCGWKLCDLLKVLC